MGSSRFFGNGGLWVGFSYVEEKSIVLDWLRCSEGKKNLLVTGITLFCYSRSVT